MTLNASQLLIMANVRTLPVEPIELAAFFGAKVMSYGECERFFEVSREDLYRESTMGFSFMIDGGYVIAVNENACGARRYTADLRQRWTIAHELGHCVLNHAQSETRSIMHEREADRFAAELLAPLTVLQFCGVRSAEELGQLCGLSAQAAGIRFKELSALRKSGAESFRRWRVSDRESDPPQSAFLCDKTSMALLAQFAPFSGQYIYESSAAGEIGAAWR